MAAVARKQYPHSAPAWHGGRVGEWRRRPGVHRPIRRPPRRSRLALLIGRLPGAGADRGARVKAIKTDFTINRLGADIAAQFWARPNEGQDIARAPRRAPFSMSRLQKGDVVGVMHGEIGAIPASPGASSGPMPASFRAAATFSRRRGSRNRGSARRLSFHQHNHGRRVGRRKRGAWAIPNLVDRRFPQGAAPLAKGCFCVELINPQPLCAGVMGHDDG